MPNSTEGRIPRILFATAALPLIAILVITVCSVVGR